MSKEKVELGDLVRDRISGFQGVVICRSDWIYGCTRFGIAPRDLDKDGGVKEAHYLDENQLEMVEKGAVGNSFVPDSENKGPAGNRKDPPMGRPGE